MVRELEAQAHGTAGRAALPSVRSQTAWAHGGFQGRHGSCAASHVVCIAMADDRGPCSILGNSRFLSNASVFYRVCQTLASSTNPRPEVCSGRGRGLDM